MTLFRTTHYVKEKLVGFIKTENYRERDMKGCL